VKAYNPEFKHWDLVELRGFWLNVPSGKCVQSLTSAQSQLCVYSYSR